jgi:hypothetical protein
MGIPTDNQKKRESIAEFPVRDLFYFLGSYAATMLIVAFSAILSATTVII